MKAWHMGICIGLMGLAVLLAVAGAGAFAFVAPLGCAAMMAMMVWMMVPSQLKTKVRGLTRGSRRHQAAGR